MLTVLMNYIFVFSIGIFIGIVSAFEIFQKQLQDTINLYYFKRYMAEHGDELWDLK